MKMQVTLRCLDCQASTFTRHGTGHSNADILKCENCGARRTFNELAKAAATDKAAELVHRTMEKAFRGCKGIKYQRLR